MMNSESRLKPGAVYIYEQADGVTYAREFGAPVNERFEIGREYKPEDHLFGMPTKEVAQLVAMAQAAETNPALQDALDRAKIIYELSREHNPTVMHHPV